MELSIVGLNKISFRNFNFDVSIDPVSIVQLIFNNYASSETKFQKSIASPSVTRHSQWRASKLI